MYTHTFEFWLKFRSLSSPNVYIPIFIWIMYMCVFIILYIAIIIQLRSRVIVDYFCFWLSYLNCWYFMSLNMYSLVPAMFVLIYLLLLSRFWREISHGKHTCLLSLFRGQAFNCWGVTIRSLKVPRHSCWMK